MKKDYLKDFMGGLSDSLIMRPKKDKKKKSKKKKKKSMGVIRKMDEDHIK